MRDLFSIPHIIFLPCSIPPAVPRSLFSPGTPAPFITHPSALNGNSP